MKKNNKRDKKWLRNRDQKKSPKLFTATFVQNIDGSFAMLGGETKVLNRVNQYSANWTNIVTRDFARELRNNKIIAR